MANPLNQLPANAEWIMQVDEETEALGKRLGCPVVVIAIQPGNKLACATGNVPDEGHIHEGLQDLGKFFGVMSFVLKANEFFEQEEPRQ